MISTSVAAIVDAATAPRKESNSIELVEKKTWTPPARGGTNSKEEVEEKTAARCEDTRVQAKTAQL